MKCVIQNETPNYLSGQHKYTNKQAIFLVLKKTALDKHNETTITQSNRQMKSV